MLVVNKKIEEALYFHAKAEYPEECCGIILGKREGEKRIAYRVIPIENMGDTKQKATHFIMDPLEVAKIELSAEQERLEIIGFYHSHPDYEAIASSDDALYMIAGYSYPILSVRKGVCVRIACFEKRTQTSTEAKEEKIMIQGEEPNADTGIYLSNIANICKPKGRG